jgi:hypothetical protein
LKEVDMLRMIHALSFVLLPLTLAACGSLSSLAEWQGSPTPEVTTPVGVPADLGHPGQLMICIDRSTSYRFTNDVLEAIAEMLPQLVRPGPGWSIHLRWLAENSYRPEAAIMNIKVPPLPAEPTPPPDEANPFARREDAGRRAAYDDEMAGYLEQLSEAKADVQDQAAQLRGLSWEQAYGSDIWGCVQKASELLGADGGWLLIASDLEEYGQQQKAAPSVNDVHVHIVYWQVDEAARAAEIQETWRGWLGDAGAVEVKFHDPAEGLDSSLGELTR